MPPSPGHVDYGRLVEDRRVHGSLYTDPQVFEDEIDRIFRRGWVFVGHESEIPEVGDWVTRRLGREPVVMVRAADKKVHVLANRCAHRGTMLCWQDRGGGRKSFQCSYHGWVFGLDGTLRSLPGKSGFESAPGSLDLARPGQVDIYQGFVFANPSGDAGPLDDHLGEGGKRLIDRAVELSPAGRLKLGAGWIGQKVASNWKMWPESDNDGYHLAVAHASLQKAVPGTQYEAALFSPETDNSSQARDHGLGHVELELRCGYDRELAWLGTSRAKVASYAEALERSYGKPASERILWDGPPHALIFPNLFLGEMNLAIVEPVAPDVTVHYHTPLLLDGVDAAFNDRVLRQSEAAMGPASFFLPDDAVIAERMQQGWRVDRAARDGWIDLSRGAARERSDALGKVGHVSDETTNRGFWQHYRHVMRARA